jgi:hypothetical protein
MNQSDATLAAEALAAECLALQSEVARLRGVIEDTIAEVGECVLDRRYCIAHSCKPPCWADSLRAALQPKPVENGGEG